MADELENAQAGVTEQTGTQDIGGQPETGTEDTTGQPVGTTQDTGGEPSGGGLPDGMTPEGLFKSYQDLQRDYSKKSDKLADMDKLFQPFGGPDKLVEWATYLSQNPDFPKWVSDQQNKNILGVNNSDLDEETQKALQVITVVAEKIADQKIQQAMKSKVEPLASSYKERLIADHFSQMDKKYEGWREMQDLMSEISETLPEQVQDNPTFDIVEDLYFKALRQTGKMDDYAARVYARKLEAKKKLSTEKPSAPAGPGEPPPAKSIEEAFEQAKKQLRA